MATLALTACVVPEAKIEGLTEEDRVQVATVVPAPVPSASPTPSSSPSASCVPEFRSGLAAGKTTYRYNGQTSAPYGFIEYLPNGYNAANTTCLWPVVLMLHGAGETGDGKQGNLEKVAVHGPNRRITDGQHFPAIIITPQSPGWWNSGTLDRLVDYIYSNYRADPDRLYITGLSMGGGGTWDYARAYPNKVAAIMPVCGASSTNNSENERQALNRIGNIWAFHSIGDGRVTSWNTDGFMNNWAKLHSAQNTARALYQEGKEMTGHFNRSTMRWEWNTGRTVKGASGQSYELNVHYTMYPDNSHNSWTRSYGDNSVWTWLFSQRRN